MALRQCRDCGHEVSDQAIICPDCGCQDPARRKCMMCSVIIWSMSLAFVAALLKTLIDKYH